MFSVTSNTDASFEAEFHNDANRVTVKLDGPRLVSRSMKGDTFVVPLTQLTRRGRRLWVPL
jgi:hypothetical protein